MPPALLRAPLISGATRRPCGAGRPAAAAAAAVPPPRWVDLPPETLGLILARLPLRDRCRAVAVPRAWRSRGESQPEL